MLSAGDGMKRVFAQFQDAAGNTSADDAHSDNIALDTHPPLAPRSFTAIPGDGQVSLSWSTPIDVDFQGVLVLRSTEGFASAPSADQTQTSAYAGQGSSCVDSGKSNGTRYYYTAFAQDRAGNWSTEATAGARPGAPTALAIVASPSTVSYNGATVVSGLLTASAVPLPDKQGVSLWSSADNGASWQLRGAATYSATAGRYLASARCTRRTTFQMRFDGEAPYASSLSAPALVRAFAYLPRPSTPSVARRRYRFSVSGILAPRHTGSTRLYFYRRVARRWVLFATTRARNSNYGLVSRYLLSCRIRVAGTFRVRANHADADHLSTWSAWRAFIVK
jgi:hypothetical protein